MYGTIIDNKFNETMKQFGATQGRINIKSAGSTWETAQENFAEQLQKFGVTVIRFQGSVVVYNTGKNIKFAHLFFEEESRTTSILRHFEMFSIIKYLSAIIDIEY